MQTSTNPPSASQLTSAALGVAWWYFLLRGLLLIIAGAVLLFKPGMGATAFVQVIGAFMLIDGILAIVSGFTGYAGSRLWTILRGVPLALIGWVVFSRPALVAGFAATTLIYILASFVLIGGIFEVIASFKGKSSSSRQPSFFGGALLIAFGLLLLFAPLAFGLVIVQVVGAVAILIGIILLFLALRSRKLRNRIEN